MENKFGNSVIMAVMVPKGQWGKELEARSHAPEGAD